MKAVVILFFFLMLSQAGAQSVFDSLEKEIQESTGIKKIDLQHQLAMKLVMNDPERARSLASEYLRESQAIRYVKGEINATNVFGIIHDIQGNTDSSRYYFTKGYELAKLNQLTELEGNGLNNLGMMHWNKGDYNEALGYFLEALKIYEIIGLESGISKTTSNIGLIYQELNQFGKALGFHFRALDMRLKAANNDHIARSYNNIGICYKNLDKLDSALQFYNKALYHAELDQSKQVMSQILSSIANIYSLKEDYQVSIDYHKKALKLAPVSGAFNTLATYSNLASLYNNLRDYHTALDFGLKGDSIVKAANLYGSAKDITFNLANTYMWLGKPNLAQSYFLKWQSINDSIYGEQATKAVAEMQEKYETEKKEQEIRNLKAEAEIKELQIIQNRLVIVGIASFSILLILLIVLTNRHRTHKLRARLAEEREKLQRERFKVVLETEENERKRVARELHDGLGQMLSTVRLFVSDMGESEKDSKIDRSLKALDATITEVRNISHNMMPLKLIENGLSAALTDLASQINESGQLKVLMEDTSTASIGTIESMALYRCIQEVINNTLKYAKATTIRIRISDPDEAIRFSISDDGIGFNTKNIKNSRGIGWSNIYSRMELIGAVVSLNSSEMGTTVEFIIPKQVLLKAG